MISWLKQLRLGYRAPGWSALLTGQGVAGQTTREQPVCPRRSLADLPTTGPVSFDLSSVTCRRSTRLWVFLAANYKGTKMPAIRGICQFCAEASSARGTTTCQPCVYAIMEYREDGAKEVALEFGVTKNVIIGLWNRHKGPNAPRHKSAGRRTLNNIPRAERDALVGPPRPSTAFVGALEDGSDPRDHGLHGCKWPFGHVGENLRFCKQPKKDHRYCAYHVAKARRPPKELSA